MPKIDRGKTIQPSRLSRDNRSGQAGAQKGGSAGYPFGSDLYCRKQPFGLDLYTQKPPFGGDFYCNVNSEIMYS